MLASQQLQSGLKFAVLSNYRVLKTFAGTTCDAILDPACKCLQVATRTLRGYLSFLCLVELQMWPSAHAGAIST